MQTALFTSGAILLIILGYFVFIASPEDPLSESEMGSDVTRDAQIFLVQLRELQSITFSNSLFQDARFDALEDYSQPIVPEELGKENPFRE